MNDTFDIFLHMNLTEGKAGRNVVEGGLLVFSYLQRIRCGRERASDILNERRY
jgi:hypothetical protein